MRSRPTLALLPLLLLLAWGRAACAAGAPLPSQWETDWQTALNHAAERKLPLVAMFSTPYCLPCNTMKKSVLTTARIQNLLNTWVPVYLDADAEKALAQKYKVAVYPTFVFMNSKGEELASRQGAMNQRDFAQVLVNQRDYVTSAPLLQQRLRMSMGDASAYKAFGDLLLRAGKINEARRIYEAGVRHDPANKTGIKADALYVQALSEANTKPDMAVSLAEHLAQQYPTSPRAADALFLRGLIALNANDKATARANFQQYAAQYPKGQFIGLINELLAKLK